MTYKTINPSANEELETSYVFERNKRSKTPRICASDFKVGEKEAEAYDRRVDQALASPRLLLQTKMREDPDTARVYASRSEIGGNISTRSSPRPRDLSNNANTGSRSSPLMLSVRLCTRPTPRALLPTLLPRRLLSAPFRLFGRGFVPLTARS